VICLVIFCSFIFTTNNFIVFYVSYECSLLPIIFIIIKFGKYSNRYLSSLILIVYTSLFAVPFLFVLGSLYVKVYSFSITFLDLNLFIRSFNFFLFSLIRFLIFLVKLPCYGLHFWLPLAHVEAPTSGSIILAGILLKLRVIGIIRFRKFITHSYIINYTQSYFVISIFCATLLCCFQSDFKSLVAYSSISHMRFIPLLILSNTKVFFNTRILISLFHGFSSVFIFILVSQVYLINKTRQIYYIHGLIFIYPVLTLLRLLSFMVSLSIPPFPRFFSEVISFVCISSFSVFNMLILFLFSFISGVYRLQ
jgi:NADH-quinone oxidoreductase subunit M